MPKKLDEIKKAIMREGRVKPLPGKTKEQSAYAIATSTYKKMKKPAKVKITSIQQLRDLAKKRA